MQGKKSEEKAKEETRSKDLEELKGKKKTIGAYNLANCGKYSYKGHRKMCVRMCVSDYNEFLVRVCLLAVFFSVYRRVAL